MLKEAHSSCHARIARPHLSKSRLNRTLLPAGRRPSLAVAANCTPQPLVFDFASRLQGNAELSPRLDGTHTSRRSSGRPRGHRLTFSALFLRLRPPQRRI